MGIDDWGIVDVGVAAGGLFCTMVHVGYRYHGFTFTFTAARRGQQRDRPVPWYGFRSRVRGGQAQGQACGHYANA